MNGGERLRAGVVPCVVATPERVEHDAAPQSVVDSRGGGGNEKQVRTQRPPHSRGVTSGLCARLTKE